SAIMLEAGHALVDEAPFIGIPRDVQDERLNDLEVVAVVVNAQRDRDTDPHETGLVLLPADRADLEPRTGDLGFADHGFFPILGVNGVPLVHELSGLANGNILALVLRQRRWGRPRSTCPLGIALRAVLTAEGHRHDRLFPRIGRGILPAERDAVVPPWV